TRGSGFPVQRRRLEAVGQLGCQAVGGVFVIGTVSNEATLSRLVDFALVFHQVGVGQIQSHVLVDVPAGTEGQDGAVRYRDAGGAMLVVGRRLIQRQTSTQHPLRVELVGSANGEGPGVLPLQLLLDGFEIRIRRGTPIEGERNVSVFNHQGVQAAPAGPSGTAVQGPLVIKAVGHRGVNRLGHADINASVVFAIQARIYATDLGITFKGVFDLGFVVQAPRQLLVDIYQHTKVVAVGDVVPLDVYFSSRSGF